MTLKNEAINDGYYPQLDLVYTDQPDSVYGQADDTTLKFLAGFRNQKVVEIAAGDGRYTIPILLQPNWVLATDIDTNALIALQSKIPLDAKSRYLGRKTDIFVEGLPANTNTVDLVVCTAFLYLFPENRLRGVFNEVRRALAKDGSFVFDFVTDIRRETPEGTLIMGEKEVRYSRQTGIETLSRLLTGFHNIETGFSTVDQDLTATAGYRMRANKISILARN